MRDLVLTLADPVPVFAICGGGYSAKGLAPITDSTAFSSRTMKRSYFIDWHLLSFLCFVTCTAKEPSLCNVRGSSESDDHYVVECTIPDHATLAKLPTIVKSTQIHGGGEDGDAVMSVDPGAVDEFRLNGPVKELRHNAFSWLPNLRRLIIDTHSNGTESNAQIRTHETSFGGLANLTSLTLLTRFTADSVVPTEVLPDSLRTIGPSLQQLVIQDADLEGELGKENLKYFPNLRDLSISSSPKLKLSDDEGAFSENAQLQKLELKRVSMDKYTKSIGGLKKLKILRLEDVHLSELPPSAFSNFATTLTELHIDKNPLTTVDPALFSAMSSLKILTLTGSGIRRLPNKVFTDLLKLDELSLSGNQLETLPDHLFQNTSRLVKLDLSKNLLRNISQSTLAGLEKSLLHLDLSENRLQAFHAANLNEQLGLSLGSNEIEVLRSDFFESGSAYSRLILSNNPLKEIEVGAFSGVSIGSGNLYIQRANLTWLDLAVFHGMKSKGGSDDQAQIIVSNCPDLVGVNISRQSIKWPSGVKQIVFLNNPKFVLAMPTTEVDEETSQMSRFLRKTEVRFVFDGYGLCNCRWNWLRVGKFAKKEVRNAAVDFGYFEESSPATCCNIGGLTMEDFLDDANFGKHCNGTIPLSKEAAAETCVNFDASAAEEPEAKKR